MNEQDSATLFYEYLIGAGLKYTILVCLHTSINQILQRKPQCKKCITCKILESIKNKQTNKNALYTFFVLSQEFPWIMPIILIILRIILIQMTHYQPLVPYDFSVSIFGQAHFHLNHLCRMDSCLHALDHAISNIKDVWLVFILRCFIEIPVIDAISLDPDQTPRSAASDLGLDGLPLSLLWNTRHK